MQIVKIYLLLKSVHHLNFMENTSSLALLCQLKEELGSNKFTTEYADLELNRTDRWHASVSPDCVVYAETVEDVQIVMRFANKHGIPVTARGGGVGYVGGCVPVAGGIALSLARMNRICAIDAADGVAVIEPGVITGDLQAEVRKLGMFYPPDPASLKECTIGGNVATNAGGPRCLKYGVTRHYILGLEVVLADGRVLRTGNRCHKNKTGFDLIGMFVGSEGLLGIVTQITVRLLPHPPSRGMLSCSFQDFAAAAEAVQGVLRAGHLPSSLEISDQYTLQAARDHVGSNVIPDGQAHLLVELDGQEASVHSESAQLKALLESLGGFALDIATTEEDCERLWDIRRAFSYSLRATGLAKLNEDIVVPRGRLVELAKFTEQLQAETGFQVASFGHAGDGNIHVNIMVPPLKTEEHHAAVDAALDRLFQQVLAWGGVISGEHGIGLAKKPWFQQALPEVAIDIHQMLKRALDPRGLLNPGKFVS